MKFTSWYVRETLEVSHPQAHCWKYFVKGKSTYFVVDLVQIGKSKKMNYDKQEIVKSEWNFQLKFLPGSITAAP